MIVVDLGCKTWGRDESVHALIERFRPVMLFGFDPHPEASSYAEMVGSTAVMLSRRAAWTHDGWVRVVENGICTSVAEGAAFTEPTVQCFDLASFLLAMPEQVVVKMDVEGAEYPLLRHLAATGADRAISLLLVEWHTGELAHGWESERPVLRCPVEEWPA